MKRILITFVSLLVAIPLAIGIMAGLAYYTTTDVSVPSPAIKVMEQDVLPVGYVWHEPVFGGLLYRDFEQLPTGGAKVPDLTESYLKVTLPDGYDATVSVLLRGEEVWSGSGTELASYKFLNSGDYGLKVDCMREAGDTAGGHGVLNYVCSFKVAVEPRIEVSDEWVLQGDVVALRVFNLPIDVVPEAITDLGDVIFSPTEDGTMTAYIPTGHTRETGIYPVQVKAGSNEWELQVRVVDAGYQLENIVVEGAEPPAEGEEPLRLPTEADRSPADFREYSPLITPLLGETTDEQLWDGVFTLPVNGEITVDYGLFTYQSNATDPLRQTGIGIAADPGAPVLAPNSGKVIYAGDTNYMGNVVIIEHGGGLKSLLFFLGDLKVAEGDTVAKDQQIAVTGTYTFSSIASVYYEVRLGYETVNPEWVCNGTSQLYHFS